MTDDLMSALRDAERALTSGDVDRAGDVLLETWSTTRAAVLTLAILALPVRPATAAGKQTPTAAMHAWLARWRAARPTDLAPLLEELEWAAREQLPRFVTPRLDAVTSARPDPRTFISLCEVAREAERRPTPPSRPFLMSLGSALSRHVDPRLLEELIDEEVPPIVRGVLRLARHRADQRPPDTTSPATRAQAERLAQALRQATPTNRSPPLEATETALRAAIYAEPNDPTPRLVFRDWLLERADPWGELLLLHSQRAADTAPSARERTLVTRLRPRILGPLHRVPEKILSDVAIDGGFVTAARVNVKGVTRLKALLSEPVFGTVQQLVFEADCALTPNLSALRRAAGVTEEALRHFAHASRIQELALEPPETRQLDLRILEQLRDLRVLALTRAAGGMTMTFAHLEPLWRCTLPRGLTTLAFDTDVVQSLGPDVLAGVPAQITTLVPRLPFVDLTLLRTAQSWRLIAQPSVDELTWLPGDTLHTVVELVRASGLPVSIAGVWRGAGLSAFATALKQLA